MSIYENGIKKDAQRDQVYHERLSGETLLDVKTGNVVLVTVNRFAIPLSEIAYKGNRDQHRDMFCRVIATIQKILRIFEQNGKILPWGWNIHDFIEIVNYNTDDGVKEINNIYGLLGHYVLKFNKHGTAQIHLHQLRCGVW